MLNVLSSLGGSGGGGFGQLASSALSAYVSNRAQNKSIHFQREMAKKQHQYEVADLRAAGINPVLTGMNHASPGASGGAGAPGADFSGVSALGQSLLRKENQLADANLRKVNAEANSAEAVASINNFEKFFKEQYFDSLFDIRSGNVSGMSSSSQSSAIQLGRDLMGRGIAPTTTSGGVSVLGVGGHGSHTKPSTR